MTAEQMFAVDCPVCPAKKGVGCNKWEEKNIYTAHYERWLEAKKLLPKEEAKPKVSEPKAVTPEKKTA